MGERSRKHVEDNVRSAPLIFRMKPTVCVKIRLEKEEMCTAGVRGLARVTWFGVYGLKTQERLERTKHPPRNERVNCRVRTRGTRGGTE